MYWIVACFALALACTSSRPNPDGSLSPPADTATADAITPAQLEAQATLAQDLVTLGERRLRELEALAPKAEPSQELLAFGPCTRPDEAQIAALTKRIKTWIVPERRDVSRLGNVQVDVRAGCVEGNGVTALVQWDHVPSGNPAREQAASSGHWWLLSVRPGAIKVLDEVHGMAKADWMEWANEESLEVVALVDIDHDGVRDAVTLARRHEGGSLFSDNALRVASERGVDDVGSHFGSVGLARLQPDADAGTVVITASIESFEAGGVQYRCVDGGATWSECPAAERARRFDLALEAAVDLARTMKVTLPDRDALAAKLALLEVPAPEANALLARAEPSSISDLVTLWHAGRMAEDRRKLPGELAAFARPRAAAAADVLRGALGDSACGALADEALRDATRLVTRHVAGHERALLAGQPACAAKGSCKVGRLTPEIALACVGSAGTLVFATWEDRFASKDPGGFGFTRGVLYFLHGRALDVVIDAIAPMDQDDMGQISGADGAGLRVKASLHDGHATALVGDRDDMLTAVVDGAITGKGSVTANMHWQWGDADTGVKMTLDPLARSETDNVISFWRAGPTGVALAATFPLPKLALVPSHSSALEQRLIESERRLLALEFFDTGITSNAGVRDRAELLQSLALAGADPALVTRVRPLLPPE